MPPVAESALLGGKLVAVVGSGPAGMSAAMNLARHGADVQVFEFRSREACKLKADATVDDDGPGLIANPLRSLAHIARPIQTEDDV